MKKFAALILVAALAACGKDEPAGSSRDNPLIGTWEITDDAGTGGTVRLTLRTDGTFELFIEAFGSSITTTGTYQVNGDRLRLAPEKSTMVDEDGNKLEFTSEEELADASLNGTYVIEGDTLFITLTEDGEEIVVVYRRI